jgi:hypothetical protein
MRWAEHVTRIGAKRNANRVLVEIPQRNRPFGRTRRRWEDNIEVNLKEKAWERMDWIQVAQDRYMLRAFVNTVLNLHVT